MLWLEAHVTTALTVGTVVVLVDQAVKQLLHRRLGSQSVSLGWLGSLRMVRAPLWLTRADERAGLLGIWTIWMLIASTLVIVSAWLPASRIFVGLVLGGSVSNAVERTIYGTVSDYVCTKHWPAFNLADVALTAGAVGLLAQAVVTAQRAVS